MSKATFSKLSNVIYAIDVIDRIEELQYNLGQIEGDHYTSAEEGSMQIELDLLLDLQRQAEGISEWEDGTHLVRDSHFKEYVRDECYEDCEVNLNEWPFCCIDWEAAAEQYQHDWRLLDFDGSRYWIRDIG